MPLYWWKMVTHRIILTATGDQCDLRELKKRNFRVPLHSVPQSTPVIQCFPGPFDEVKVHLSLIVVG